MSRLKVFSYNIHKGFSGASRRFTLGAMRDEIRNLKPDLVFLQEVHGHHEAHKARIPEWPSVAPFEFLAEELWPHFRYGKNAVYEKGHHGNVILSRYPILEAENIDVSASRFESRGLLHAVIQVSSTKPPLHAICAHLGLLERYRKQQIIKAIHRLSLGIEKGEPVIMAGDFNDWRERATDLLRHELDLREVFHLLHGEHALSFPSFLPVLRLDRIYFHGLKPVEARCLNSKPWTKLSDHLPLEAVFKI